MLGLLLLAGPTLAQEVEMPGDVVTLPTWLVAGLSVLVTVASGASLLLVDRALKALRESYPPGTVDVVTKSIADGLEQALKYLRDSAPGTPTNVDDVTVDVLGPLLDQLIERLRNEGVIPQMAISMGPGQVTQYERTVTIHDIEVPPGEPGALG
jgi:hypothetical protein